MKRVFTKNMICRLIAVLMLTVMAFMLPSGHLYEYQVRAASKQTKYIKEVKIYFGSAVTAGMWCKSANEAEGTNWEVLSDALMNASDYESFMLKDGATVFLLYQTTTDPKEAITDLAVMNERGNYSEGAYAELLKSQRDTYVDLINDTQDMLNEYRANYENKVPTAVQAHDLLNTYIEDDSGTLLGDLLLEADNDTLVETLLQANGQIVLLIQQQLAYACDTGKSTWLDRMSKLGSFQNLRKQYIKAYNNNTAKADKALKKKYHETALIIAENWNDVGQHIANCRKYYRDMGFEHMSDAEMQTWWQEHEVDDASMIYERESSTMTFLASFPYDDATLYDFFAKPVSEISGENIKYLYPLAACLTDGQLAGLNEAVSMYSLIEDAANAIVYNGYESGKAAEIDDEDIAEDQKEAIEEIVEDWNDKTPTSIYDGVDREVFADGGVAVTSTAESFDNGEGSTWSDSFVDSGKFAWTAGGLAVGSLLSGLGALVMRSALKNFIYNMMDDLWLYANTHNLSKFGLTMDTMHICQGTTSFEQLVQRAQYGFRVDRVPYANALNDLYKKGISQSANASKISLLTGLKIGLTVFAILLAVADIVMTVITLVNYYDRDHIPIPHHMVDLSYDEDKESSYITYKIVTNVNGNKDLYGGSGKQWLALYYTKDEEAGDPILAPDKELNKFVVQRGSSSLPAGYSPLHLFGTPNAAQNLTYADEKNGWTYNDDAKGNYLFFKRDPDAYIDMPDDYEDEDEEVTETSETTDVTADGDVQENDAGQTADSEDENSANDSIGTTMTVGNKFLFGGIGAAAGVIAGFGCGALVFKRKRKK